MLRPPKPYRRRKDHRRAPSAPIPTAASVMVTNVAATDSDHLLWTFSDDVVHWPSDNIPELSAADNVGSGFVAPFECELVAENQISAHYAGVDFGADGFNWLVSSVPVGVNFVGGGILLVPEAG